MVEFTVGARDAGKRLDVVLGAHPDVGSRSQVARLVSEGWVLVDGVKRPKSFVRRGRAVGEPRPAGCRGVASRSRGSRRAGVCMKTSGCWWSTSPRAWPCIRRWATPPGTLVHALLGHGLAGGEEFRPGIVHRLDKDTSGLLVVAKSVEVHRRLVAMMRRRAVDRRYLALVHGNFASDTGTIEAPVGRDPANRKSMTVGGMAAREARTHFEVLERFGDFTLVEVRLETGRTHQIRVHFLAIGHPVAGDPTYARRDALGVGRQFLHSYRLSFEHPMTGDQMEVEAPLPADLEVVLTRLRNEAGQAGC